MSCKIYFIYRKSLKNLYYGFSRKTYFVGGVDSLPDIRFSKNLPASKGSHKILMVWKSALSLKKIHSHPSYYNTVHNNTCIVDFKAI